MLFFIDESGHDHGDLTTAVQLADIVAHCFNWGTRLAKMMEATRKEIEPLAQIAFDMRYVGKRLDEKDGKEWPVYGVFYVDDLRPRHERDADAEKQKRQCQASLPTKASELNKAETGQDDNLKLSIC